MNENRNLILSIVLSIIILVGFEFYSAWRYPVPVEQDEPTLSTNATSDLPKPRQNIAGAPSVPSHTVP